jgi:hypothetical protein
MRYCTWLLAIASVTICGVPVHAGILFGRHNKANPAERIPQLVVSIKSENDESKRASAVKELRDYDAANYPEVMPILIDVVQHDSKASVRSEAVQSLAKLRPMSQEAGAALEEATRDASFRVRWQARNALMSYRMSGYHGNPKPADTPTATTSAPTTSAPAASAKRSLIPFVSAPAPKPYRLSGETAPPPLAQPETVAPAEQPQRLMLTPTETPQLRKPPARTPAPLPAGEQGPDLPPS